MPGSEARGDWHQVCASLSRLPLRKGALGREHVLSHTQAGYSMHFPHLMAPASRYCNQLALFSETPRVTVGCGSLKQALAEQRRDVGSQTAAQHNANKVLPTTAITAPEASPPQFHRIYHSCNQGLWLSRRKSRDGHNVCVYGRRGGGATVSEFALQMHDLKKR